MKLITPICKSTKTDPDCRQWEPTSFDNFLKELDHIVKASGENHQKALYRGQTNYKWPIDCSFVRNAITKLFGIQHYWDLSKEIRHSLSFHRAIVSLLLLKFGTLWTPSQEVYDGEKSHGIDPWYELLKHLQQYSEKDSFIKGTFLTDWSVSKEIGLYFATYSGLSETRHIDSNRGVLWVCDPVATGKTLQLVKLGDILEFMSGAEFLNGDKTSPLIFHPERRTHQPRAKNQLPIYISQMDFRYDIVHVWASYEKQKSTKIFVGLIMTNGIKKECAKHLETNKVTEEIVYPE